MSELLKTNETRKLPLLKPMSTAVIIGSIVILIYLLARDFDSLLYLCEGAFKFLPSDTYSRLTAGVVFPCYVTSLFAVLLLLAYTVFVNWR